MIAIACLLGAAVGVGLAKVGFGQLRPALGGSAGSVVPASVRWAPPAGAADQFPPVVGARPTAVRPRPGAERWWVATATAGAFAVVAWRAPSPWVVPAYFVLTASLVQLSAADVGALRISRRAVYTTWLLGAPLLVIASAGTGRFGVLVQVVVGAAAASSAFVALHLAVRGGLGFGDVRLAALCGGFLAWSGYRVALTALLLGFVFAGVVAGVLVVFGGATRRSHLPFAPMLSLGSVAAIALGAGPLHLPSF